MEQVSNFIVQVYTNGILDATWKSIYTFTQMMHKLQSIYIQSMRYFFSVKMGVFGCQLYETII